VKNKIILLQLVIILILGAKNDEYTLAMEAGIIDKWGK
jgi:hypothetical protein